MTTKQRYHKATSGRCRVKVSFRLGRLVITPGASQRITDQDLWNALARHSEGDWGDLDQDDWEHNDLSLVAGLRLLSVYHARSGEPFWIITEADRSATTVLLPEDY